MSNGRRFVVVLGAAGGGGELVADALVSAGIGSAATAPTIVNDGLLHALRATRSTPPDLADGWEDGTDVSACVEDARAALPSSDAVWFDSATATLLPFWCRHVARPDLVVIAVRGAAPTVRALQLEGLEPAHAQAMWERTTSDALAAPAGLPVLVVDLDRLHADPALETARLEAALTSCGLPLRAADLEGALVDAVVLDPAPELSLASKDLSPTTGFSESWCPVVSDPPEWSVELLTAHLQAHRAALEARDAWLAVQHGALEDDDRDRPTFVALQRETWRLRDQIIGLEAERANLRATMVAIDGQWHAAAHRAEVATGRLIELDLDALEDARRDRDQMLASKQWRAGRLVVGPFRRLGRWLHQR